MVAHSCYVLLLLVLSSILHVEGLSVVPWPSGRCSLPKVVGPCKAAFPRWFFNTKTRRCERFIYGGCQGNANNFNSLAECLNTCNPSVLQCPRWKPITSCLVEPCRFASCPGRPNAICINDYCGGCNARFFDYNGIELTSTCKTCKLPRVVGPCRAAISRWFYNTTSKKCEHFKYGGCRGNSNNFNQLADCLNTCAPSVLKCPPGTPVVACLADPCEVSTCRRFPRATCISDFCGGCNARYFNRSGCEVTSSCDPPCNPKNCGTTCPNPIPPGPNQCCPRCRQDCRVVLCLRPPCNNPIFPPGECCGVCPVTTPPPTTSPPTTTPAPCDAVTCPPTFCPNPIPSSKPKRCCPRCRQDCRVVLCLRPPCNNPIFPPGECCGICPVTTPPPTTSPPTTTTSPPSPCDAVTCPPIYCPRPIPPRPKQCCSRCKQDCRLVRCGRPLCSNPIVPLGKCCGVCPVTPTPPTCPIKGQVYKECGSACPPTCGDPNPNCFLQCQAGCICPTGTVLDTTKNVCVPLAKCTPTCPIKGQVYKECGSACPPTCGNPNPICTLQCQAGCMCPTGTVLDTTKNVCVSQAKCTCPPTCSRDYCRKNPKSVCTNTGPREIPGCTGQCQLTLCRACYYSSSCFSRPTNCPTCYTRYTGKRLQRCLKYWAYCVRKNYHYRRVTKQQCPSGTPKFKCWNPPCPLRG